MIDQRAQRAMRPWQAIGVFLALTVCFSGLFWALINITQTAHPIYVTGLMWTPGLAAMLTCRILGRPLSTLGWTWNARYALIGYVIPIIYCLVASLGIWILGFGGFPNAVFVRHAADSLGMPGAPQWFVTAFFVVLSGTVGMVPSVAAALGEEIGWRGFLVPELARVLPFTGVAVVSGLVWAAWHYPIMAVVYRDVGLPAWFWLLTFTAGAVAISFAQAWLRLETGSLWPAVFLHASHNLWMQSIFTPLTTNNEYTKWVAGDLGLALVVVAAVVAVTFWLKSRDLVDARASETE
jgi:uncharacterized protein